MGDHRCGMCFHGGLCASLLVYTTQQQLGGPVGIGPAIADVQWPAVTPCVGRPARGVAATARRRSPAASMLPRQEWWRLLRPGTALLASRRRCTVPVAGAAPWRQLKGTSPRAAPQTAASLGAPPLSLCPVHTPPSNSSAFTASTAPPPSPSTPRPPSTPPPPQRPPHPHPLLTAHGTRPAPADDHRQPRRGVGACKAVARGGRRGGGGGRPRVGGRCERGGAEGGRGLVDGLGPVCPRPDTLNLAARRLVAHLQGANQNATAHAIARPGRAGSAGHPTQPAACHGTGGWCGRRWPRQLKIFLYHPRPPPPPSPFLFGSRRRAGTECGRRHTAATRRLARAKLMAEHHRWNVRARPAVTAARHCAGEATKRGGPHRCRAGTPVLAGARLSHPPPPQRRAAPPPPSQCQRPAPPAASGQPSAGTDRRGSRPPPLTTCTPPPPLSYGTPSPASPPPGQATAGHRPSPPPPPPTPTARGGAQGPPPHGQLNAPAVCRGGRDTPNSVARAPRALRRRERRRGFGVVGAAGVVRPGERAGGGRGGGCRRAARPRPPTVLCRTRTVAVRRQGQSRPGARVYSTGGGGLASAAAVVSGAAPVDTPDCRQGRAGVLTAVFLPVAIFTPAPPSHTLAPPSPSPPPLPFLQLRRPSSSSPPPPHPRPHSHPPLLPSWATDSRP